MSKPHVRFRRLLTAVLSLAATGLFLTAVRAADDVGTARAATSPTTAPSADSAKATAKWALTPLTMPAPPDVKNVAWVRNPIDRFILGKLESQGLSPQGEASRAILIRRLSYDLLGLPPSPAEIDAFVKDPDPAAYEKLVDGLLASPHYGERWARHWLDLARYTESHGFEYDRLRDTAWHFRDYVIDSFNHDKPYDRFVKEQIAGDALMPVTQEGIVGSGLLVCGAFDEAGNAQSNVTQRAAAREEEMEDLLSVIGQTFLGMTVNCARCHNHKFDPIPQADYYRLKSVFDGVKHGVRPILTPDETRQRNAQLAAMKQAVDQAQARVAKIEAAGRQTLLASASSGTTRPAGPQPLYRWDFDSTTAPVGAGTLAYTLNGGAAIAGGRLHVDGKGAYFQSVPIPQDLGEKTLEAWLTLPTLDQGGGAALSIETEGGGNFDAIVFAERQSKKWVAGSNGFERSRDLEAKPETAAPTEMIHVAIVYRADGSISVYRNGIPYAASYTPTAKLQTYKAGTAHVLIGRRHTGGTKAFLAADVLRASVYDRPLSAAEIMSSYECGGAFPSHAEIMTALTPAQQADHRQAMDDLKKAQDALKAMPPEPTAYAGTRVQPAPTHRLNRGSVKEEKEVVTPGALSAVTELDSDFGLAADAPEAERRLKLADWIASSKNPLTPRVMANRLWHYHFGMGIVDSPNDFGFNGGRPSHPELLDFLAATFIERGWSMKAMHRLICNSATYRQSSTPDAGGHAIDADDRMLWRFPPKRLEAEAVRDAMLSVSGNLNPAAGGPSFRPWVYEPFPANAYRPIDSPAPELNRRTVYRMNVNSGKSPLLEVFDCPEPSVKTPSRRATTTPLQALALMNNPFVQRQANGFADRVMREANGEMPGAIALAYRYAYGREATAEELQAARTIAQQHGMPTVCWAILNSTEFLYVR